MWKEDLVSHLEIKLDLSSPSSQNCRNFSSIQPTQDGLGTVSLSRGNFWHPDEVRALDGLLCPCPSMANNLHQLRWLHLCWNLSELGHSLRCGVWLHCSVAFIDAEGAWSCMKWPLDELRTGQSLKQFGLRDSLQPQLQIQFGVGPSDVGTEASSHFSRRSALYHHPSSGRERRNCLGCLQSSRARWDTGHKQTAGRVPRHLAMLSKTLAWISPFPWSGDPELCLWEESHLHLHPQWEKQAGKSLDVPFVLQMFCGNSMNNAYKFNSFLSGRGQGVPADKNWEPTLVKASIRPRPSWDLLPQAIPLFKAHSVN